MSGPQLSSSSSFSTEFDPLNPALSATFSALAAISLFLTFSLFLAFTCLSSLHKEALGKFLAVLFALQTATATIIVATLGVAQSNKNDDNNIFLSNQSVTLVLCFLLSLFILLTLTLRCSFFLYNDHMLTATIRSRRSLTLDEIDWHQRLRGSLSTHMGRSSRKIKKCPSLCTPKPLIALTFGIPLILVTLRIILTTTLVSSSSSSYCDILLSIFLYSNGYSCYSSSQLIIDFIFLLLPVLVGLFFSFLSLFRLILRGRHLTQTLFENASKRLARGRTTQTRHSLTLRTPVSAGPAGEKEKTTALSTPVAAPTSGGGGGGIGGINSRGRFQTARENSIVRESSAIITSGGGECNGIGSEKNSGNNNGGVTVTVQHWKMKFVENRLIWAFSIMAVCFLCPCIYLFLSFLYVICPSSSFSSFTSLESAITAFSYFSSFSFLLDGIFHSIFYGTRLSVLSAMLHSSMFRILLGNLAARAATFIDAQLDLKSPDAMTPTHRVVSGGTNNGANEQNKKLQERKAKSFAPLRSAQIAPSKTNTPVAACRSIAQHHRQPLTRNFTAGNILTADGVTTRHLSGKTTLVLEAEESKHEMILHESEKDDHEFDGKSRRSDDERMGINGPRIHTRQSDDASSSLTTPSTLVGRQQFSSRPRNQTYTPSHRSIVESPSTLRRILVAPPISSLALSSQLSPALQFHSASKPTESDQISGPVIVPLGNELLLAHRRHSAPNTARGEVRDKERERDSEDKETIDRLVSSIPQTCQMPVRTLQKKLKISVPAPPAIQLMAIESPIPMQSPMAVSTDTVGPPSATLPPTSAASSSRFSQDTALQLELPRLPSVHLSGIALSNRSFPELQLTSRTEVHRGPSSARTEGSNERIQTLRSRSDSFPSFEEEIAAKKSSSHRNAIAALPRSQSELKYSPCSS